MIGEIWTQRDTGEVHTESHVKTQQEGGHVQAKERGCKEPNPTYTLILDVQNCEKIIVCGILLRQPVKTKPEAQVARNQSVGSVVWPECLQLVLIAGSSFGENLPKTQLCWLCPRETAFPGTRTPSVPGSLWGRLPVVRLLAELPRSSLHGCSVAMVTAPRS